MSYAMTHLIIAERFASHFQIQNKEIFLAASIAPDAVHQRADFTFEKKAQAHDLMPDERWGQIYTEKSMIAWYERLIRFYQTRKEYATNENELDFLKGYTLHILVDIFNCKLLYGRNLIRYEFKVDEMRDEYRRECILQDNYLYQNWEKTKEVFEAVEIGTNQLITDEMLSHLKLSEHITVQNMKDNWGYQCDGYQKAEPASLEGLEMVSVENSNEFLDIVSSESIRMLFDFPKVERTFQVES